MILYITSIAMAIEVDPYSFNMLKLGIDLKYTDHSYGTSDRSQYNKTSIIEQRYRFDIRSRLIDPRLIVYDAGIEFVDTDTETTYYESHNEVYNYNFKSIILRKTKIPLTLYANRNTSDTTFGGKSTTDRFGAEWYIKFRTLPWTKLNYDKMQTQTKGSDGETETREVELTKKTKQTDNNMNYSLTTTTDSIRNYERENSVITFKNDTKLPLNSDFRVGLVKNNLLTSDETGKDERDTFAGSVNLRTMPGKKFDQNYSYTFTESEYPYANSDTNSKFFSGSIGFRPTDKLKLSSTLNSSMSETTSQTTDAMTKRNDLTGSANYSLTSEWSTSGKIKHKQEESTTSDPLTGKKERTILDASGALNYNKKLSWADFSAGSSIGYHKETATPEAGGEGISYGFNTGLGGIDMRYFALSSAYSYSAVDSYVKNTDTKTETINNTAVSSYVPYLPLSVSHVYSAVDHYLDSEDGIENSVTAIASMLYFTYLPVTASYSSYTLARPATTPSDQDFGYVREKEEDTFKLNANLTYFKNTDISAYTTFNRYKQTLVDVDSSVRDEGYEQWGTGIEGSHTRNIFRGRLNIKTVYGWSVSENVITDVTDETIRWYIGGEFDKRVTRNLSWSMKAGWNDITTNGLHDTTTSGETMVFYRLRQWLLSVEYLHSIKKQELSSGTKPVIEDKVMLRASRSIVRIF